MINNLIPAQGFELIRDRIAEILMCEFKNQANVYDNSACDGVKFFAERTVPVANTEAGVICIGLWKGDYSNKEVDAVDGHYEFVIDFVANAKSRAEKPGDELSAVKLHKLMGTVRYILEHSIYATLLFDRPFIGGSMVKKFQVIKPEHEQLDATSSTQGQMIFGVRCVETTDPIAGKLAGGQDTTVRLENTAQGYEYVFNT